MVSLIKLLHKLIIALGLIALGTAAILTLACCKAQKDVLKFEDNWMIHSIVPIDTNGMDKTLQ